MDAVVHAGKQKPCIMFSSAAGIAELGPFSHDIQAYMR